MSTVCILFFLFLTYKHRQCLSQDLVSEKELLEVAKCISGSSFKVGIQFGVKKEVLDRIEIQVQENRRTMTMERAAFEMLHKAQEGYIFSCSQELSRDVDSSMLPGI